MGLGRVGWGGEVKYLIDIAIIDTGIVLFCVSFLAFFSFRDGVGLIKRYRLQYMYLLV